MGRGKQLNEFQKGQIVVWKQHQQTVQFMAQSLGVSRTAISNYLKDPENYGKRFKGGRPSKLSVNDVRQIFRTASKTGATATTIVRDLNLAVSPRWVRHMLKDNTCFEYVKRNATPLLTKAHMEARLKYAKKHLESPPSWSTIIWSDEKKFNLDGPDGLQCYWRDLRHPKESFFSRKFGGRSVMVWAGFSSDGATELAFLEGNQNSCKYIWTLQDYLFPFAHQIYKGDFTFMQDGASIHRSKETMEFLTSQNVNMFEHPALSPDLNPIENLWGILVRGIYAGGKQYHSVEALILAIKHEWSKIDVAIMQRLVDSMPRRCVAVIESNGALTPY
ncbi:hypothetical protein AaE_007457 [Aphanomyces astaci]|uniref:Tc1-like transposase DDE domain-containing protein n=1 Tax=Aphanomyces astaci TaxID=112090 RepID=A0A6A5AGK0_APHAT|nr:hypothetical protein AaE_007457 [Aphanomyces astaci]